MSIFLCWSGARSLAVATCLKKMLQGEGLQVEMSPDIAKGEIWFQRIMRRLRRVQAGVVVLTPENLKSPWLHFEAGILEMKMGLGRTTRPRIFPYLFHTQPVAVDGPLGQYQLTVATKEDTCAMVEQLRQYWGRRGEWTKDAKEKWWADLAAEFQRKATLPPAEVAPALSTLFNRKTFHEPVHKCVARSWLQRYNGAQSTLEALRSIEADVDRQCRPYAKELLQHLIEATDGYAMTMGALLLEQVSFDLNTTGDLVLLPPGVQAACESRRIEALRLQAALVAATQAPIFDESAAFDSLDTFAQKKDVVHRKEAELRRALEKKPLVSEWWKPAVLPDKKALRNASTSVWMLDRILFYVTRCLTGRVSIEEATGFVWREWEKVGAREDPQTSRMALHYSLDVLEKALEGKEWKVGLTQFHELRRLFRCLRALETKTRGSRIVSRVTEMRSRLRVQPSHQAPRRASGKSRDP